MIGMSTLGTEDQVAQPATQRSGCRGCSRRKELEADIKRLRAEYELQRRWRDAYNRILEEAIRHFNTMSSVDGSGHADLARAIVRMKNRADSDAAQAVGETKEQVRCQGTPCHCDGKVATHVITYPNGESAPVSVKCANMYILAGYRCRKITCSEAVVAMKGE